MVRQSGEDIRIVTLRRLKERKLVQWALAYVAGAFALLQGVDIVAARFAWPGGIERALIIAACIGFFVALVLAWYHGERGAQRVSGMEVIVLAVLLGIGGGLLWQFARAPESPNEALAAAAPRSSSTGPAAEAIPPKSIAVLAFADLSPHHDKGYFSDGIAEELLNALARVSGLKVAGRTSSFRFKDRNDDLRTIGRTLGVAHVLEGSVRTQGDKVRITAQLIRTRDGFNLWSQAYDGDLEDVFAVQENIARRIVAQLQVVLSGRQAEHLVEAGTRNPDAYALYLQATATFNRRDGAHFDEALGQLRQAITLDPDYARAYSRMATLETVRANYAKDDFLASMSDAERDARKASALDPRLAEPHAALSLVFMTERRYREGRAEMARALALDPNDVTAAFWHALSLVVLGYHQQGAAALDRVLEIDPLLPNALVWRASLHVVDGEFDVAQRQLQRAAEGGHSFVGLIRFKLDRARGDPAAAARALATGLTYFVQDFPPEAAGTFARTCVGDATAKRDALRLIDDYLTRKPEVLAAVVPYVLLCSGDSDRAFALAGSMPTNNDPLLLSNLFNGLSPDALRTPAFAAFVRRIGLTAYWDEFGPPDFCGNRREPGSYVCK